MPPPRPHPVRRRPRVAGRRASTERPGLLCTPAQAAGATVLDDPAAPTEPGATEPGPTQLGPTEDITQLAERASGRRVTPIRAGLVVIMTIALGLAAWFSVEAHQWRTPAPTSNAALLDVGATAQVSGQVRDAVERVFSYDFARLDDNERAAAAVITGPFARDYHQQFARVRELAPGQQAVVVATVPALAVKLLDGERAIVVVFIDQQANRGGQAQPLLAAGRLRVTAQRVNGSWRIAGIEPF